MKIATAKLKNAALLLSTTLPFRNTSTSYDTADCALDHSQRKGCGLWI